MPGMKLSNCTTFMPGMKMLCCTTFMPGMKLFNCATFMPGMKMPSCSSFMHGMNLSSYTTDLLLHFHTYHDFAFFSSCSTHPGTCGRRNLWKKAVYLPQTPPLPPLPLLGLCCLPVLVCCL